MTTSTKCNALKVAGIVLTALLGSACEGVGEDDGAGASEEVSAAPAAQTDRADAPAFDDAALQVERVLRRVERGDAKKADADALANLLAESKLPAEALDRASLGLSVARQASGDTEGAIRAVEDLLRRHGGDSKFELHDAARARLRLLVTGTEVEPPSFDQNMEPSAPIARALVPFFPEDERGVTLVDILSVGKAPSANDPHGIFNLRAAKRQLEEEACAVCDIDIKMGRSHSRIDSWVDFPMQAGERRADMPNQDRSMVVVYFDLTQNRVPSRYDAYLAIPSDEAVERLERGGAFVAVRERPGNKPLVMLAAPRAGLLDFVETAFAEMTTLPNAPVVVEVPKKLQPAEIQGVVRSGFKSFRTCYEKVLANDPKAAGSLKLKFRIDPTGVPAGVTTESSFADPSIGGCVADQMATLRFPISGQGVDVTYPIAFSP